MLLQRAGQETLGEEDVGEADGDRDAALVPAVHEVHARLEVLEPARQRLERRVGCAHEHAPSAFGYGRES